MNTGFATEYFERRMRELGHGEHYLLKLRHLVLRPNETRKIDADSEYFFLVEMPDGIRVESKFGLYDLAEDTNEIQYEHFGKIRVTNKTGERVHVRFIQCIPVPCPHDEN